MATLFACTLACAAGGFALRPFESPSLCLLEQRLDPYPRQKCVIDSLSKLMLCSAPKAGKVTTVALMTALTNKTLEMRAWLASRNMTTSMSTRMLTYWKRTQAKAPRHLMPSPDIAAKLCASPGWLCLVLVRNPMDRALSSFFHVAAVMLGARWPELLSVVGAMDRVRAGNYTFKQHVAALELMPHTFSKGGWGVGHVLPQHNACLEPFFGRACDRTTPAANAPRPYKLITIDDLPRSLAAADAEFRGGLGLGRLALGLHSAHWRSERAPTGAVARRPRSSKEDVAHAGIFASQLCGHRGGLPVPRKAAGEARGIQHACKPAPDTYRRMQAANAQLWARIRCLFADDFYLYHRAMCEQEWLRSRCPTCVAKACGGSSGSAKSETACN